MNKEKPYLIEKEIVIIKRHNPNYNQDKLCECGHKYYRHFDTYEDMRNVGCKYCNCSEFKVSKIEIDKLMKSIYYPNRYRWCEAGLCGCMGCVNRSDNLPITKEEWREWVKNNPEDHDLCEQCYTAKLVRIKEKDKNGNPYYECPNCTHAHWKIIK